CVYGSAQFAQAFGQSGYLFVLRDIAGQQFRDGHVADDGFDGVTLFFVHVGEDEGGSFARQRFGDSVGETPFIGDSGDHRRLSCQQCGHSVIRLLYSLQKAVDPQPVGEEFGPFAEGEVIGTEADSVGAALEDVHLGDNARFAQGEEVLDAVFGGNGGIAVGMEDEGGRGLRGDGEFAGETAGEFGIGIVAEQVFL
ncbi:MAG: hypothetical protein QOJ99_106, partial [Bryobacterales bacterium]|nr:hypothetical protein [Bryobacterales bacterium]